VHKKTDDYIKKSLKGIWSPFFRKRIRREILDHVNDLVNERKISEEEAITCLGQAEESNTLYKKLMYKKMRSDSIFYGGIFSVLFTSGVFFIHNRISEYNEWTLSKYQKIEKKYKEEVVGINHFKRKIEKRNAASFLDSVFDKKDKLIREDFLNELQNYDFWDPVVLVGDNKKEYFKYTVVRTRRIAQLAKLATKKLNSDKTNKNTQRNFKKVAELIYSTETMSGYRVANNMLDGSLFDDKGKLQFYFKTRANRASGTTWGLLNLMPQIVSFEKSFKNVNYYTSGICHHAYDFWYGDSLYEGFTKSALPFEVSWEKELTAYQKIKKKMKKDCRLSFLNITQPPKAISRKSMWVTGPDDNTLRLMYENLIVSVSQVPYLRSLAGRYLIYRTSIPIQGPAEEYYAQN
tara:strand:+ start:147035 stop:148249 length:1215 start_codon:yes stop_codon:yes gene_type:complete